jgi:hypothetical protein
MFLAAVPDNIVSSRTALLKTDVNSSWSSSVINDNCILGACLFVIASAIHVSN